MGERLSVNHFLWLRYLDRRDWLLRGVRESRHVPVSQHRLPLLESILIIVFVLQVEQILILEEQVPRTHRNL